MNRKTRILLGVGFGLAMTLVYGIQILGNRDIPKEKWPLAIGIIIIAGALAGFLFIGIMWIISRKWSRERSTLRPTKGEEIAFETNATRLLENGQVGGKLFLTNRQLIFLSHSKPPLANLQIPISILEEVKLYEIPAVGADGLLVKFQSGETTRFFTQQSTEWVNQLSQVISKNRTFAG